MKKILSLLMMVSMLMTVIPFTAMANETTSTLKEIFSFDMNGDNFNAFKTQYQLYHGTSNKGDAITSSATNLGTVYGIGTGYYGCTTTVVVPLGTTKNANGQFDGVKKTGTPNQYIEAEFDYAVNPYVYNKSDGTTNNTYGAIGATLVTYASDTSTEPATSYNYGSFYHKYNSDGTTKFYRTNGDSEITGITPEAKKWYRVKLVSQLTDANGSFKSSGNATHVYIDGVPVASYSYPSSAVSNTNEYVSLLRLHQSNGRAYVDNLSVRTYQAGDAPVDKGALIAAIRNFEASNPNYTNYPGAVSLINAAKATYENPSAEDSDVEAAIANVENADDAMVPVTVVYEQDFEDNNYDAYLTSINAAYNNSTLSNAQKTDNSVFAIGKYESRTSPGFNIPLTTETETISIGTETTATVPKGIKVQGNNLYVQTEFDYKVLESEPQTGKKYSSGGLLLTGFRKDTDPYGLLSAEKTFGTIYHQYKPAIGDANADAVFTTYSMSGDTEVTSESGQYIADAQAEKWRRIKIVTRVTNGEGNMSASNEIYFYVDGQPVKTRKLSSTVVDNSDGVIRFLRQHLSYGKQAIDNISVVTYNDLADAPVDKGALVAAIRDFEADYPSYTSSDRAVELLNAAKAVYNNSEATPDNVTEAIAKVNTARNIFNPENGIAVYCDGEKIIVNGSVSSETALDDEYRTILAYFGENDELLTVEMSEGAKVEAGNNPVYFESELYFPYQRVVAYVWTTNTLIPLCTPVSDTFTALKVLAIGNSFSQDAMTYLYQIAENSGEFDVILLANAYNGGCSLEEHMGYIENDSADYSYEIYGTKKTSTADQTLKTILKDQKWNLITLQQNSANSGDADTYSYLPDLISWVKENKTNPHAKLAWHMTWAYSQEKLDTYSKYDKDQMTMYNAILSAVESKILTNDDISFIIPTGTAIQNLRTVGENIIPESLITRDGQHVGHEVGRYAAGLTWFKKITGHSIDNITYMPGDYVSSTADDGNDIADVNEETLPIIKKCVNNAINTPFAVTQYTK